MIEGVRKHHFPISGDVVTTGIATETGEYVAFRDDAPEIRGHGHSRLSALADLNEKSEQIELGDEDDAEAAAFDHAHDLRKHAAA
jgi:hypothetical protein